MSFEQIAGQLSTFYIAGNGTTTAAISFTLYELSQHVGLMIRAQQDVEKILEKHNGQLTYESINEMQFIDSCVKETLRKYPLPILNRQKIRPSSYLWPYCVSFKFCLQGMHQRLSNSRYRNDHQKRYTDHCFGTRNPQRRTKLF